MFPEKVTPPISRGGGSDCATAGRQKPKASNEPAKNPVKVTASFISYALPQNHTPRMNVVKLDAPRRLPRSPLDQQLNKGCADQSAIVRESYSIATGRQ